MPNRYYIGNPRTILTPDAYESVFAVDSYAWRTNRLRKLTKCPDARCSLVPKESRTNVLVPIPNSNSHLVNMIRDTYHTETSLIFVPAIDSLTIDDKTAICFEVPDFIFPFVGFPWGNASSITLHLCFHGKVYRTLAKGECTND